MKAGCQLGVNREKDIIDAADFGLSHHRFDIVIVQHVLSHPEAIANPSCEGRCEIFCQDHLKETLKKNAPKDWRLNGHGSFITKEVDTYRVFRQLKSIFPEIALTTESFFVHDPIRRQKIQDYPWWHKSPPEQMGLLQ